ncbi:cytochrome P450, putative [Pediculus humanus corporis]|uniref:Cytochrome P450, putative n=1 Tax=Pediculus humanus subsp. corporis TaxID=121224 RepID=E0VDR0_PEDHC|nr:cytochrome P450, putative [Pediculus humanus corporis]EEB11516.1 cytochrome P450, putative [Pediculus humanus corporis]
MKSTIIRRNLFNTTKSFTTAVDISDADVGDHLRVLERCKPYSEVPGPKGLPFIGNSWRFLPLIGHYKLESLDKVMESLYREYGDVVKISGLIGHPDLLFIFNPNEIERIFKREETLPHRPSMPSVKYYKQVLRKDFFGKNTGVVGVHGQQWNDFRSKVHQTMMQPSTAKKYLIPLNQITTEFLNRIQENIKSNDELSCDFMEELYKWALESIGKVALDTRLGCLNKNLEMESEAQIMIDSVKTFFANVAQVELRMPVWRIYSTPAWKKYIGAFDVFRETCLKYINESMIKLNSKTLKDDDDDDDDDIPLVERILLKTSDPKVATVLALDLLLVGIDTTSVAATTIIYHLAKNPEKQEKLYRELYNLLPNDDDLITEKIISQSVYLSACIKESLRIKPVIIGNGRSLTSNAIINNYQIPKGTHVIFPHYVVGNLPEYFPKPQEFIPERWLKSSSGKFGEKCPHENKIHRFASLPFGYGRRTCLGRRFAEIELKILISKIFRKYKVSYNYGLIKYQVQSTYKSSHPIYFHLKKRK